MTERAEHRQFQLKSPHHGVNIRATPQHARQTIFTPYRGSKYFKSRLKLLILGESHYDWPDRKVTVAETTATTIGKSRFHGHIRNLLGGGADFWDGVAFYNYVQCFAGDAARQRPTPEMWGRSHLAFGEVLKDLKPQRILVLGKTTWLAMAGEPQDYPGCLPVAEKRFSLGPCFSKKVPVAAKHAYWYPTASGKYALTAAVYHPAYPHGFSQPENKRVAKRLMDRRSGTVGPEDRERTAGRRTGKR